MMFFRSSMLITLLLVAGCGTLEGRFGSHLESPSSAVRECAHWYRALDIEVDSAAVRDGQHARVAGFPYLRTDRFHSALRSRAEVSAAGMEELVEHLLELDLDSRRHE